MWGNFYKNTSTTKITINKKPHKNGAAVCFGHADINQASFPPKKY
jgi:hypothetical protein